jgi:two-component system, response regulator PdtaR
MKAKKILIVEDDKMLSTIYKMFIKDLGHELIGIFPDGKSAIEICEKNIPDIVLMDIQLEGDIDGIATTKILQNKFDTPVIFVSGITDPQTIQKAIGTKSYGFIVKPVDKTELGIAIEQAFTKHKYENELKVREYRYKALIQDSPDAVILIVNEIIEYINFSGLKLFGTIHIEDMLEKKLSEFISDDYKSVFEARINKSLQENKRIDAFKVEFNNIYNQQFSAILTGSVINFKNQKAIQLIVTDISESESSKNILLEQDNIIENLYDGIITLSLAGKIKYLNKGAERILGIDRNLAISQNISKIIPTLTDSYITEHILEPALENENHEIEINFIEEKSNEEKSVKLSLSSLRNTHNETTGIVCYCKDNTSKKQILKKIKENEEKFRLLSLSNSDAYWDLDLSSDEIYFSEKFKEFLGYKDSEFRNSLEEWKARIESCDREKVFQLIKNHIAGYAPFYAAEYRILHKDETYRWFSDRGLAIRDENGIAKRMMGTVADITEQKNAQFKIRTSEANLKAIFNSNKEAIFLVDRENKIIDHNKRATQLSKLLFGKEFGPEDSIFEVLNFISFSEATDLFYTTLEASATHKLERSLQVNNSERHIEISIYPVLDSDESIINRFCVSFFDVTDRIKIEKDLKETKLELRPLFDSSIQRFYLCDFEYKLVAFNKAAHEAIKEDIGRILKKGDNILELVPTEIGKSLFIQRFNAARKGEHIVYKDEIHTNSGRKWIETHIEPISNEKGEIIRVLVWTLDITKEKEAEEALIESQKKYFSLFSEANDAILLINDETDRLVDCNEKAILLFKYSKEELNKLNLIDLAAEYQRNGLPSNVARQKIIDELKSGGKNNTFSWCYKKKNGEIFDAEVSLSIVNLENIRFRFALIRDITDRLKMEEDLRRSEQHNRSLVQAIPDLIFIIDTNGNYKDFMADNDEVYAVPSESIVGKNLTNYFEGGKLVEFRALVLKAIETKKVQKIEYELDSRIGKRWFEARLTYLNNNEVFCLVRDIHDSKMNIQSNN